MTTTDPRLIGADSIRLDGTPVLTISVCPRCTSRWFPPRDVCSACAHDGLDGIESGPDGVAYASTVVRIAPTGFTAPYLLSYVDVDGVRVLAHTDPLDPDDPRPLAPGTPVRLTSGPTGHGLVSYRATTAPKEPTR